MKFKIFFNCFQLILNELFLCVCGLFDLLVSVILKLEIMDPWNGGILESIGEKSKNNFLQTVGEKEEFEGDYKIKLKNGKVRKEFGVRNTNCNVQAIKRIKDTK